MFDTLSDDLISMLRAWPRPAGATTAARAARPPTRTRRFPCPRIALGARRDPAAAHGLGLVPRRRSRARGRLGRRAGCERVALRRNRYVSRRARPRAAHSRATGRAGAPVRD